MADSVEFFVPCVPPTTTAQQKRTNRKTGAFFKSDKLEAAEATYQALFLPHRPDHPITMAVEVEIVLTWPWRAGEPKWRQALGSAPKATKPDADNAAKQLIDVLMSLRFIGDDAAVSDLIVRKRWGSNPGVSVRIEPLVARSRNVGEGEE